MARFCGNCGAPMDDDARVCGQCGAPVDDSKHSVPGLKEVDPAKKKKIAKAVKLVIALALVAIIAVVGVRTVLSFTGTNGFVRKVMKAYEQYDIDAMVNLASDMYYYNDNEEYVYHYFENAVGSNIDSFESTVGHSYKMTYSVEEIYEMSQRKMDETLRSISVSYPYFDTDTISKISVANVKITAKQGSKSSTKNINITMAKEGKNWKLLFISCD